MKIEIKSFFNKYSTDEYHHGLFISEDIHALRTDALLNGADYIEVPDDIFDIIEQNKNEYNKREKEYQEVSSFRIKAIDLEKNGLFDDAIISYKECISKGINSEFNLINSFSYAYERIIILLHKTKRYDEEAVFINQYLKHSIGDKDKEKYSNRLKKLKSKL